MIGRYALFDEVAHGGMATVHVGRLVGPAGFSKTVAIKKMHGAVARNPEFIAMFLDEARLSGRIQHPNAVGIVDVIAADGEVFLIMEYVHGEPLSSLTRATQARHERVPPEVAVHVVRDALYGLHAAHEARDEQGEPLLLVHRDVSPQNILVGVDGVARVCDFGIAKAVGRLQETSTGQVKGKVAYMAPEQLLGKPLDRRVDVFAAGIVLWETLTGRRLFAADSSGEAMYRVLEGAIPPLAEIVPDIPPALAAAVARATSKNPDQRFATAEDFARELEHSTRLVSARTVGDWVRGVGGSELARRGERLREIESTPISSRVVRRASVPSPAREVEHVPASADEPTRPDAIEDEAPPPRRRFGSLAVVGLGFVLLAGGAATWLLSSRGEVTTVAPTPQPPGTVATAEAPSPPIQTAAVPAEIPPAATASVAPTHVERPRKPTRAPSRPSRRPEDLFSRE
jgi:serine/threonine-protein kinase